MSGAIEKPCIGAQMEHLRSLSILSGMETLVSYNVFVRSQLCLFEISDFHEVDER